MRIAIILTALLGGFIWLLNPQPLSDEPYKTSTNKRNPNTDTSHVKVDTYFDVSADGHTDLHTDNVNSEFDILLKTLSTAPLNGLKPEIIRFWQICKRQRLCDQQLALLKKSTSDERYSIVAHYPERMSALDTLMGSELISHSTKLKDKIALVKTQQAQIWGSDADDLFAAENQFYEDQLALSTLQEESQYWSAEETLDALNEWQESQGDKLTAEEKYQQALSLLDDGKTSSEQQDLRKQLANQYFPAEKSNQIRNRQDQVAQQEADVQGYQAGLSKLKSDLAAQQNSSHNSIPANEWDNYVDDQITQYRKDYFSSI